MAYCTYADVRRIINTSLPNADITSEITLSDAEMDARDLRDLSTNVKKDISRFIVASKIALRDPQSGPAGETSISYRSPAEWRSMAEDLIARVSTSGANIDWSRLII